MTRLEAVYLSNVILYIESIETIIKLLRVNKKCREAIKIIRYYNRRKLYENDNYYCIVNNIFDLFPNIETISCREKDILNKLELFDKVKQIELFLSYMFADNKKIPQEIKNKIVKLDIFCYSLEGIHLNEYPNVRKVKVEYLKEGFLNEFLGNKDVRLKELIIETGNTHELEYLKEYKNIENKVIKIRDQITKERYQELKQFSNVYSAFLINGIDMKDSFYLSCIFVISNKYDINKFYDLTLFTKCEVENDCDLRNCELLEEIKLAILKEEKTKIQIEGLRHLKKIENIKKVDCIPTSVTYLSFTSSFNCKELLEIDGDCFKNIRELQIKQISNEFMSNPKELMNFKNCTKLRLLSNNNQTFEIPMSVKDLIIVKNVNEKQIKGIEKIKRLRKLEIHFELKSNKEGIEEMFDNMKELEWLKTNYIDGIKLPLSLTFLELEVNNNADLSQYINLKEMKIISFHGDDKEVIIPNKLNKLYVYGKIKVINSNEIEVERIILDNTPSQFCEWKSKNIFVI